LAEVKDAPDIGAVASFNRFIVTITDLFNRQTELSWSYWKIYSGRLKVSNTKKLTPQTDHLPLLIVGTYRSDERPTLPNGSTRSRVSACPAHGRGGQQFECGHGRRAR
jgi:hypothetical protein